jgi:CubicO group peptidase (beta-lactamase class C family)
LPEGWADYSARLTPGSETYGYGAGFWTNRGTTGGTAKRIGPGVPPDSFMASGPQGRYIVIAPSAQLVVVRLGMAHHRFEDIDGSPGWLPMRLPPRRNRSPWVSSCSIGANPARSTKLPRRPLRLIGYDLFHCPAIPKRPTLPDRKITPSPRPNSSGVVS